MSWPSDDDLSARIAIVQLSALGIGTYKAIANAFRIHERSVYNYIRKRLINYLPLLRRFRRLINILISNFFFVDVLR
jgi:DNA-binding CsgD family transcriptional regulator